MAEGLRHVAGDGTGHEQAVGVPRRGHEVQAEPLEVVVRAGESGDLELAAVARPGIDLADVQRAAEARAHLAGEGLTEARQLRLARRRLGDDARARGEPELAEHGSAPPAAALLALELEQHGATAFQMAAEDAARDVEQLADGGVAHRVAHGGAFLARVDDVLAAQDGQVLRHARLVEGERVLELLHAVLAVTEDLEDAHPRGVAERLEEVGLQGLQLEPAGRLGHAGRYIRILLYSQARVPAARAASYTATVRAMAASIEWRARTSACPRRASSRACAGAARSSPMAAARAAASAGGTTRPVSPSRTSSGVPPTVVPTTGVPTASACGITWDIASDFTEGSTSRSRAAMTSGTSRRKPVMMTWRSRPSSVTRRRTSSKPMPSPTMRKRVSGWRRSTSRAASRKKR